MSEIMRGLGLEAPPTSPAAVRLHGSNTLSANEVRCWSVASFPVLRGGLATLLVGAYDTDGQLRYCGHVGTGMSQRERASLVQCLADLQQSRSPFTALMPDVRNVCWVRPELVVDIEYRQFTGRLRHPTLKAVLTEVDSATIVVPLHS